MCHLDHRLTVELSDAPQLLCSKRNTKQKEVSIVSRPALSDSNSGARMITVHCYRCKVKKSDIKCLEISLPVTYMAYVCPYIVRFVHSSYSACMGLFPASKGTSPTCMWVCFTYLSTKQQYDRAIDIPALYYCQFLVPLGSCRYGWHKV